MRTSEPLPQRVIRYARHGLTLGVIYSVIAVLIIGVGGTPQERAGPLGPVVVAYLVTGTVAGGIIGALLPRITGRFSAMLVGLIAAVPVCYGVTVAAKSVLPPSPLSAVGAALLLACILGPACGFILYRINSDE